MRSTSLDKSDDCSLSHEHIQIMHFRSRHSKHDWTKNSFHVISLKRTERCKSRLEGLNLTWLGERNSWLFSLMYMLSPSNCGQMERRRLKFDWSDSWDKGRWFAYQTERGKKGKNNSIKNVRETRREKMSVYLLQTSSGLILKQRCMHCNISTDYWNVLILDRSFNVNTTFIRKQNISHHIELYGVCQNHRNQYNIKNSTDGCLFHKI